MQILLLNYNAKKDNKYNLLDSIIKNMQHGFLFGKLTEDNLFIDINKGVPMYPVHDPNYVVTAFLYNLADKCQGVNIKLKNGQNSSK